MLPGSSGLFYGANMAEKYTVLAAYQCPNTRRWLSEGGTVELLPAEAEFLILSGKVERTAPAKKAKKGEHQ